MNIKTIGKRIGGCILILFISFIILIISIGFYVGIKHYSKVNEAPYFTKIPDAQEYDLQYNKFKEYYIIVNPPKDIQQLKELIKKYNEEHSIEEENSEEFQEYKDKYGSEDSIELQERIERYKKYDMKIEDSVLKEIKEGKVPNRYLRVFLEETRYLPRDWKPKGSSDIIDDHVNDIIATVSWPTEEMKTHYEICEREDYNFFDEKRNRKILNKLSVTE